MAFTDHLYKILVVAAVWIIGAVITYFGVRSDRYKNLSLSIYQPKSWIFGLVWTFIYLSYLYVWTKMPEDQTLSLLFNLNMFLNLLWTVLFFYAFQFNLSFVVIVMLAVVTLVQVVYIYSLQIPESGLYMFLMLIYLSWLCVASILNYNFVSF